MQKTNIVFVVLLFTLGEEWHKCEGQQFKLYSETKSEFWKKKTLKLKDSVGFAHINRKVGIDMKSTAMKYAKQAHHRE